VLVTDFRFDLPPELIAQEPLEDRSASRMLRVVRGSSHYQDRSFQDQIGLLRPDDLLVMNNTRVFPARLYGRRRGVRAQPVSPHNPAALGFLHGRIEVLLTRQRSQQPNEWHCLVRPARKIGVGEHLFFGDGPQLTAEVIEHGTYGERVIRFAPANDFFGRLNTVGHVPLPPYINRVDQPGDRERYQTVYARERGSVAAPTAGLHFTSQVIQGIRDRGIEIAEITLHVGLGTFQPVREPRVEDNKLHSETYSISTASAAKINRALEAKRRVVAVGTTTVRTLEFAARQSANAHIEPGSGEADLFIYPGFQFLVVGALLTNFHLPESSLLMLVCAFGGQPLVLDAYRHAVAANYRFYSYGDCMFLE
jgi:S-adenosylmethionine:tRNA ribosyltransferase-isomerase